MPSKRNRTSSNRRSYQRNKKARDQYAKNWRESERRKLVSDFGWRCASCGENDPIVLDFDHIANDGHTDSGKNIIFEVKQKPTRFQLLCKNCNWRKEFWRRKKSDFDAKLINENQLKLFEVKRA